MIAGIMTLCLAAIAACTAPKTEEKPLVYAEAVYEPIEETPAAEFAEIEAVCECFPEEVEHGEYHEDAIYADYLYLGTYTATAYCNCEMCCGSWAGGCTASGTIPTAGRTVACNSLPMGTVIMIDGQEYVVEDTGYSPYGDAWIDIYFDSHDEALAWGCREVEVYTR